VNAGRVATAAALVAAAATACHEGGPTQPSGESASSWEGPLVANAWVAWSAYDGTRIAVWAARIDTR
jgi:hypothetical protein